MGAGGQEKNKNEGWKAGNMALRIDKNKTTKSNESERSRGIIRIRAESRKYFFFFG